MFPHRDAKFLQRRQAIRHQPFPARLVDWYSGAVGHHNA